MARFRPPRLRFAWLLAALSPLAFASFAEAAKLTLLDGRVVEGAVGQVGGVAEDPNATKADTTRPILILDDGLRRMFISKRRVREVNEAPPSPVERVFVQQNVAETGARIGGVGPILRITPFDEYGRRIFSMKAADGPLHVVQGITEITPVWTRVEGLLLKPVNQPGINAGRSYVWEMRIATSSIPRETLSKVLKGAIDSTELNDRLKIVRLYIQAERYQDARVELEQVVADFPDQKDLKDLIGALRQMGARRLLEEIERRSAAGQHRFAQALLAQFPGEGVAGETLQRVREVQAEYRVRQERGARVLKLLGEQLEAVKDPALKQRAEAVRDEIARELNYATLDRFAAFLRLAEDDSLKAEQKIALAISGWLLGGDSAQENLRVALSIYAARDLVVQYLRAALPAERIELLAQIKSQEGGSVENVAKLLAHMKPPLESEPVGSDQPGFYELRIPGLVADDVTYYVQLPPEYDPHRHYPTIITLNGAGTTPQQQIDWWAGARAENGRRLGQATRHGYIVIAVDWQKPHQSQYEYSAREHYAVLGCLRDANRRFSIDTDRVFLTGHSMGGDAAWDMGLAHPDLWAGVIPIVATANRYCAHYWENAQYVPFYFVAGEMDSGKTAHNAIELDRYLRRGYDTTVIEFLGRGHEHFYDEIQRLFDWMNRRERNFFPKEFECATLRPWDNYFWWIEASKFPPRTMVLPADWPPPRNTRAARVEAKIHDTSVFVDSASDRVTVWLAPELVDFQKRVTVQVNGRRVTGGDRLVEPSLEVLLEDARTRADRLHPFWARLDWPER
jgi:pimeloyl-ACP methyl ester carboxylesterase